MTVTILHPTCISIIAAIAGINPPIKVNVFDKRLFEKAEFFLIQSNNIPAKSTEITFAAVEIPLNKDVTFDLNVET